MTRRRPLLLLDVDGVLNPFPECPAGFDEFDFFPDDDAPHFGLPAFDVVPMPPVPFEPEAKTPAIATFAADRPAAWVDDVVTPAARAWASARGAPTLLVEVDSSAGLTRGHVDELLAWAACT